MTSLYSQPVIKQCKYHQLNYQIISQIHEKMQDLFLSDYKVDLSDLQLKEDSIKQLSQEQEYNKMVRRRGKQVIIRMPWHRITQLNLSRNNLGNKACKYLSRMRLDNLCELYLQQNLIGCEGVVHISKMILLNLKKIILNDNFCGLGTMKAVALANWPAILTISIQDNGLTIEEIYVSCLFTNKQPKKLYLDGQQLILSHYLTERVAKDFREKFTQLDD